MKVAHYLNQFFGGLGGEEAAGLPPRVVEGPVGPGLALKGLLGDKGVIAATIIAGDNFMAEGGEKAALEAVELLRPFRPDVLIAGPAFRSGRYGMACGAVGKAAQEFLGIPAVTGMDPENPAASMYRRYVPVVRTGPRAAEMKKALDHIVPLSLKLAAGEDPGDPEEAGYMPRGIRVLRHEKLGGAERAVAMLLAKVRGEAFRTEIPLPEVEYISPAPPLKDLRQSTIVLATEGGIIPSDNPDRIESTMATRWGAYRIETLEGLDAVGFTAGHGGYDNTSAREDPNRVVPLDIMRKLEKAGELGLVYGELLTTAGNAMPLDRARRMGREMAEYLKTRVGESTGVLLTAT
ncbi:MAG: glycine/betaine/sarcosine/D-proline family reductase selenoprotein B [Deltaproteobacteria bacterium]|nr:glycine/betaine/sarcosine/D-proline family reductase selenoprotein B [Deltaproteobacteria bacterium]